MTKQFWTSAEQYKFFFMYRPISIVTHLLKARPNLGEQLFTKGCVFPLQIFLDPRRAVLTSSVHHTPLVKWPLLVLSANAPKSAPWNICLSVDPMERLMAIFATWNLLLAKLTRRSQSKRRENVASVFWVHYYTFACCLSIWECEHGVTLFMMIRSDTAEFVITEKWRNDNFDGVECRRKRGPNTTNIQTPTK